MRAMNAPLDTIISAGCLRSIIEGWAAISNFPNAPRKQKASELGELGNLNSWGIGLWLVVVVVGNLVCGLSLDDDK